MFGSVRKRGGIDAGEPDEIWKDEVAEMAEISTRAGTRDAPSLPNSSNSSSHSRSTATFFGCSFFSSVMTASRLMCTRSDRRLRVIRADVEENRSRSDSKPQFDRSDVSSRSRM